MSPDSGGEFLQPFRPGKLYYASVPSPNSLHKTTAAAETESGSPQPPHRRKYLIIHNVLPPVVL